MSFKQCHTCQQYSYSLAQCSNNRCRYAFCTSCIISVFNPQFEMKIYNRQCWVCYVCSKVCKCNLCNGQIPENRRRNKKMPQVDNQKQVTSLTAIRQISQNDPQQLDQSLPQKTKIINKHTIKRQAARHFFLKNNRIKFRQPI